MAPRGQPDALAVHWQFLNRTQVGRALIRVVEVKLGRAVSVLHITLHQRGLLSSPPWLEDSSSTSPHASEGGARGGEVSAYVTQGNIETETGITLPTDWRLPRPPPPADLALLPVGDDLSWERVHTPLMRRLPILNSLEYYKLRAGHSRPACQDLLIRLAQTGQVFTDSDLSFVVDVVQPMLIEEYRPLTPTMSQEGLPHDVALWYPTLTLNLEVKRRLPPEGVEWLRLRAWARAIRNGRFDFHVLVFDQHDNLIVSSSQVALAVDLERNFKKRGPSRQDSKV